MVEIEKLQQKVRELEWMSKSGVQALNDTMKKLSKDHNDLEQFVSFLYGKRKDEMQHLIEGSNERSDDLNRLKTIVTENEKELKEITVRIDMVKNKHINNFRAINNVSRCQNERIEKTDKKTLDVEKKVFQVETRVL